MKDKATVRGLFTLKVYDKGVLVEDYQDANMVVNNGREALCKMLAGFNYSSGVERLGLGESGTPATESDHQLQNGLALPIGTVSHPAFNQVQWTWVVGPDDGNGMVIREFALLLESNVMLARKVRAAIEKTEDIVLEGTWMIQF